MEMAETGGYHWEWSQSDELLKMNGSFEMQFFPERQDNYYFTFRFFIASDNK